MRKTIVLVIATLFSLPMFAQKVNMDSILLAKKDSSLRAMIHADSVKIEMEFAEAAFWEKLKSTAQFPVLNGGDYSGVLPVTNPTEIPDPKIEYKLMFELTANNPDSTSSSNNLGLVEVARILNLHVASGIPINKITPVIVVHGGALNAISTNEHYKDRYKTDNPNLKLIKSLEQQLGAKFIACGQAMSFFKFKKEDILPEVKISITAQTVLSSYQLKGFVKYDLGNVGK